MYGTLDQSVPVGQLDLTCIDFAEENGNSNPAGRIKAARAKIAFDSA